jgi:hypothetical protein
MYGMKQKPRKCMWRGQNKNVDPSPICKYKLCLLMFVLRTDVCGCEIFSLMNFVFVWPCIVTNFFIIKPTRLTNFPNLLLRETLHVSYSSSVHHQEFIQSTLSNGICHTGTVHTAFKQDRSGTAVPSWSCSKAVYKPVWHIPVPSVQWVNSWWWTDELPETCRVSCQSKFGKLVHLVGFIVKKSVWWNFTVFCYTFRCVIV